MHSLVLDFTPHAPHVLLHADQSDLQREKISSQFLAFFKKEFSYQIDQTPAPGGSVVVVVELAVVVVEELAVLVAVVVVIVELVEVAVVVELVVEAAVVVTVEEDGDVLESKNWTHALEG